ncbi:hypothetical protein ACHIPZ_03905 [Antrihabitans sp. NCIMB 15449]|uniref:Deoxyribonuclease NucA/NucB domain-containing protein n=1 Tax=Antrihabitans spumae TaxID=3373370 RepID=A0ABW7JI19_9NOCA
MQEYNQAGGFPRFGNALNNESDTADGGRWQAFNNQNSIYWKASVAGGRANQIGGAIRQKWYDLGYETGQLGYPIEREKDATRSGKLSRFEHGLIYWHTNTGAHPVWGEILQTWAALGYEQSAYGFPKGDEEVIGAGKRQLFENNQYIEWQPEGFPVDWEADEDNNYMSCNDSCGLDATVALYGPQSVPETGAGSFRSAEPQESMSTQPDEGTLFCDEVQPDPSADPSEGLICIERTDESGVPPTDETTEAPLEPTSSTPATTTPSVATTTPVPETKQAPNTASPTTTPPLTKTPRPTEAPSAPATTTQVKPSPTDSNTAEPPPGRANILGDGRRAGPFGPMLNAITTADYCKLGHPKFEYKAWLGERMYQCKTKVISITMAQRQTARVFGTIRIEEIRTVALRWNNTAWSEDLNVRVQSIEPRTPADLPVLEAVQIKWEAVCTYAFAIPCYENGGAPVLGPHNAATLQVGYSTTMGKGIVAPGGGSNNGQSTWRFTASHPQFTTASGLTGWTPIIRCDAGVKLRTTQGCAFPHVAPVMPYYLESSLGNFRNHVANAQNSGLPGARGQELHRVTDDTIIRQNRAGSCGGITGPRPTGKSCDEYPFASSSEGARNGGQGRTFDNCGIKDTAIRETPTSGPGYSVCLIPKGENNTAGALLGWFYAKNRVMNGDAYSVRPN